MADTTLLPENFETQAAETLAALPFLTVSKQYCTRACGSDCKRCSVCCPHGAITLQEGKAPLVDRDACQGCGICSGVCDAFVPTRLSTHVLHKQILRAAVSGQRVYLTCERNLAKDAHPAANVMVLPCLSMLSPAFLTMILAEGVELVLGCKLEKCEGCPTGGKIGGMLFPGAVEIAQSRTGKQVMMSPDIPNEIKLLKKIVEDEDPTGRRQAFSELADDFMEIASGRRGLMNSTTLQDYALRKQQERIFSGLNIPKTNQVTNRVAAKNPKGTLFPQFRMLATAACAQPENAGRIALRISQTDAQACCTSLECTHLCPTGARFRAEKRTLGYEPMLCVGCGICADICPNKACSIVAATAEIYLDEKGNEA